MDTPFTLLWTHAAYWFIAVAMVLLTRRLRMQVERVAKRLEQEVSRS
ncbi:MAG: hypothetical protein QM817_35610 [Archangium sp.]